MNDIIQKMRNELRTVTKKSVEAYPKKARDEWLFDWPSQIILVVNQVRTWFDWVHAGFKCSGSVAGCTWILVKTWPMQELTMPPPLGSPHPQIFWCQEVEAAFTAMRSNPKAMQEYNNLQVTQLTKLIEVTRTDLKKPDRQKIM